MQLIEEPRILHCDDCLVGEGPYQLDLPIGEWLHALTSKQDDADDVALAQLAEQPRILDGDPPGRQRC